LHRSSASSVVLQSGPYMADTDASNCGHPHLPLMGDVPSLEGAELDYCPGRGVAVAPGGRDAVGAPGGAAADGATGGCDADAPDQAPPRLAVPWPPPKEPPPAVPGQPPPPSPGTPP
jgi:hypothetical protein